MKQKIEELARNANMVELDYCPGFPDVKYPKNFEKFAELLVRECMAIVAPSPTDSDVTKAILSEAVGKIDKAFCKSTIKQGSRVKVVSGFNVGAKGVVNYVDPTGKYWVRRDWASSDVFYHFEELVEIE
jgi:hypothetical protein